MPIHKLIQPVETYKGDNTLAKQIEQSRVTLSMAAKDATEDEGKSEKI